MKIKLEELLSKLGNPGRYQIFIFLLLGLNYFPLIYNHVIMAFYGAQPARSKCYSPQYDGLAHSTNDSSFEAGDLVLGADHESCSVTYPLQSGHNVTVVCSTHPGSKWRHTTTYGETTIVTEWDLVCDYKYLSSLATTIYFCGVMVGGVVFGHLADKFGRKPIMLTSLFLPIIVGVGISFVPWYSMFVVLRFIQGILMQGLQTSTYTLAMELFLPQYRSYAGALLECFWGLGVVTLPAIVYLVPNWRTVQLIISLPSLLALVYICLVPESLRWLILKNKVDQAEVLIAKTCRMNKLPLPQQEWEKVKIQLGLHGDDKSQYSVVDMLRTTRLRRRSLILFFLWFTISTGYYGLTWKLTGLAGNKYLNFFIGGSVELLAYTLVIYITKRFGRRRPLFAYFIMAAVMCIAAGVLLPITADVGFDLKMLSTAFAIGGKFAMGGLFSVIFLYTSELYPTVIRNIGMGSCAFWTRVGGVLAPQILFLDQYTNKSMPMILFGILTLIGGFLTLLLPETKGKKLPDTLDDVESDVPLPHGKDEMQQMIQWDKKDGTVTPDQV